MRVSILLLTGLLFFAVASGSGAYTKPNDVYGWENLRWGMPAGEVESVLGKNVKKRQAKHDKEDGVYTDLEMRDINIGGSELRASHLSSQADFLEHIQIII